MNGWLGITILSVTTSLVSIWGAYAQDKKDMNGIIKGVVEDFLATRTHGGYDIGKAFTRDLDYGPLQQVIKASDRTTPPPKPTMCVAASAEVIIESLNAYFHATGDATPFSRLPLKSWTSGSVTSARANIFIYSGTGSRGTGHALAKLGIGEEKTFDQLKPYDFVNLNRAKTGHSVIFISYLDRNYNEVSTYSQNVAGFKYFSAQGKGKPDAGFALRWAFFSDYCPSPVAGKPRDCGVIRSLTNKALLDGGTLWDPSEWQTESAQAAIASDVRAGIEAQYNGAPRALIDTKVEQVLTRELQPDLGVQDVDTTD